MTMIKLNAHEMHMKSIAHSISDVKNDFIASSFYFLILSWTAQSWIFVGFCKDIFSTLQEPWESPKISGPKSQDDVLI